jgi:hypothetical protein
MITAHLKNAGARDGIQVSSRSRGGGGVAMSFIHFFSICVHSQNVNNTGTGGVFYWLVIEEQLNCILVDNKLSCVLCWYGGLLQHSAQQYSSFILFAGRKDYLKGACIFAGIAWHASTTLHGGRIQKPQYLQLHLLLGELPPHLKKTSSLSLSLSSDTNVL